VVSNPHKRQKEMAEINMTPLIDVMLVLLIIFMVTAPLLTSGIDVNLPRAQSGKSLDGQSLSISISSDGIIHLESIQMSLENLNKELVRQSKLSANRPILIRADKQLNYGRVIDVVDAVRQAGFFQVGFVTEGVPLTVNNPKK
jgi:biopolymer transport protein TolR